MVTGRVVLSARYTGRRATLQRGLISMWAVHYFDRRANRAGMSRSHASSAGALRNACDLMRQNCRVDHITGPDNQRIEASAIESWCRANRNRQRPKAE
jgi:hypothetical protein